MKSRVFTSGEWTHNSLVLSAPSLRSCAKTLDCYGCHSSLVKQSTIKPPELADDEDILPESLLPPKSRRKYEKAYEDFTKWKTGKKAYSFSENVLLAYFKYLSESNKRPSTLWCEYSKLKTTIRLKKNVNIGHYAILIAFLKGKSEGFMPKKSKVLSRNNIEKFIKEAPDNKYLLAKVILIFGVNGALHSNEMTTVTTNDVETHDNKMLLRLPCTKPNTDRTFTVRGELMRIVQKYQKLRPVGIKSDRFFLNYKNGKCNKQLLGRHKIAAIPKLIATYLNLPDPESYTGHCFRRSSATLLADKGANLDTLKRHGGWSSDKIAEDYIKESIENKTCKTISQIKAKSKTTPFGDPRPSTSSAPLDNLNTDASPSSNSKQNMKHINLRGNNIQLSLYNCNVTVNPN